jgi:hypothetical protein
MSMTIYFDKGNLQALVDSPSNENFYDALKTIRYHLNIRFNFPKTELVKSEKISAFFKQITQGRANLTLEFDNTKIPARPIRSTLHKKLEPKRRSVLLLEESTESLDACKRVGACMIGGLGEEVSTINRFYLGNLEAGYNRSFVVGNQDTEVGLNSWSDLKPFTLPFSDLIITDRYILRGKRKVVEENLVDLFRVFHQGREVKSNIVLFTLKPDNNNFWCTYDLINELVADCTRNNNGEIANFTLVWSTNSDDIVHDRNIFTNYQWLHSGSSLNYFHGKRLLAKGSTLTVNNLVNRPYRKCAESLLEEIQVGLTSIKKNFPNYIQGDKKSNFLTF